MLAPVREHAARREPPPEALDRLTAHWLGFARTNGPKVGGPEGAVAVVLLGAEWANLERAFGLALAKAADPAIDAATALTKLVWMGGLGSNRMLLDAERAARAFGDDRRTAIANECLGDIALARSDHGTARRHYEQALSLYQQVGNVLGEANCFQRLGDIALRRSDHETARQRYEQALPLHRQVGGVLGEAGCIECLGDIALARSDHGTAGRHYEQALPLYQQVGAVLGEANCIMSLGDIALARSDHEGARQRYEAALPLYRQVGSVLGEANCIQSLGDIALAEGVPGSAGERFTEALALYRRIQEPYSIGWALVRLARLAEGEAQAELVAEARVAWESIDRPDLVARLEREFGAG